MYCGTGDLRKVTKEIQVKISLHLNILYFVELMIHLSITQLPKQFKLIGTTSEHLK